MKELEALQRMEYFVNETMGIKTFNQSGWHIEGTDDYELVEQTLLKAQKTKKVLEILKKYFNFNFHNSTDMLLICIQAKEDEDTYDTTACANINFLSYNPNIYNKEAKYEYDLLKEIFEGSENNG